MAEVRCRLDRMGSKCPERALRELAAKLMADGQTVREAALRAIQNAWAADVEALSLLLDALPMPHQQPSSNEAPLPATRSFRRDTPVAFFCNPQRLTWRCNYSCKHLRAWASSSPSHPPPPPRPPPLTPRSSPPPPPCGKWQDKRWDLP